MSKIKVAVDAMGGDNAPKAVIHGALEAVAGIDATISLVGPQELIESELSNAGAPQDRISIVDAPEVIAGDEQPVQAVQRKQRSSIVVGLSLVRDGLADAFVSAGNTGALMAAGLLVCGRIPGVKRPAIGGTLPTVDGKGVLILDLGAHMDANAQNLYQYAVMGSVYAEQVKGIERPRIGLLNVGIEDNKGNEVVKEAFGLLKSSSLNFVGNIEAREIFFGDVDVVICDGFVGNVVLKALEGFGAAILQLLKKGLGAEGMPGLGSLFATFDYRQYGGSPIFGVDGVCVKCHGSSDHLAILNGIRIAGDIASRGVVRTIREQLASEPELLRTGSEGGVKR